MRSAIDIVLPTLAQRREAAESMLGVSPLVDPRQLVRATEEGFLEMVHIEIGGKPAFAVWFNTSIDGGLHVNAAVALTTHTDIDDLNQGVEQVARERRLKYIRFNTARPGLVHESMRLGFLPESVSMIKRL